MLNGRAYKQDELLTDDTLTPILRVGNLFTNSQWYYSDLKLEDNKYIEYGDLIYAWAASFGPRIWKGNKVIYHYHIWKIIVPCEKMKKFLYYLLLNIEEMIKNNTNGSTMVHITKTNMEKMIIPLPPLTEQKRIIEKIEELFAELDKIDEAQEQYNSAANKLREKVLDTAMRGKLVPQDPSDEPASELLKQIEDEKQRLIKEKIIKKQKALPPIEKAEEPFDIPSSWEWVRLGGISLATKLAGFEYTKEIYPNLSDVPQKGYIPLMKGKNIRDGYIDNNFESYIPEKLSKTLLRSSLNTPAILTPYVGSIGRVAIFKNDYKAHLGSNVGKIELFLPLQRNDLLHEIYLSYYLRSLVGQKELTKYQKSTAQPSISIQAIREVLVAFPPLKEQHRIVEKIEEIFSLLHI